MSDLTMDAILADCELGTIDFMVPFNTAEHASAAYVKVWTFLDALYRDVKKADEADKKAGGEKIDPPHIKKWKADKKAEKLAVDIVGKIVADLSKYEGNDALMFHLRATVRDNLSKYLANEVEYGEWKAERSAPLDKNVAKGTKAVNAERYKVGKEGLENLWGICGHNLTVPANMLVADKGNMIPNLPGLSGNYGGNGAAASGRYAALYRLSYKVDGVGFSDPREALRAIWTGSQRVGKNTADLFGLVEKKAPKILTGEDKNPGTFTENGHTVVVIRKAD